MIFGQLLFFVQGLLTRQRSCGKEMFSVVSVRQSANLSMGNHVTIAYDALDLTSLYWTLCPHTWDLSEQGPPPSTDPPT